MIRKVLLLAAFLALVGGSLFLGCRMISSSSATFDEAVHLSSGYTYWVTGRYRLNIFDHPPFAKMWAAIPLLFMGPDTFFQHPEWQLGRQYGYADIFLYANRIPPEKLLNAARKFCLFTWTLFMALLGGYWAWRLKGASAGLWTVFLFSLSPNLISNNALTNTDGAVSALYFGAFCCLAASLETRHATRWALGAALCAGLAMASKFTMVVLPALLVAMVFWDSRLRTETIRIDYLTVTLITVLGAGFVLSIVYGLGQVPLYWKGLWAIFENVQKGRSCFFMGHYSLTGFWTYFFVAFLIKTPIPTLILGFLGLGILAADWRKEISQHWLVLPFVVYFLMALTAKMQIGYRHVLPAYPFFLVMGGISAAWLFRRAWWGKAVVLGLALFQAVSVFRVEPHLLAYFNEAVGGPKNGYHYLVDSNLDWGQGMKALSEELERLGNPPVYLCYFGTALPRAYGIKYAPAAMLSHLVSRPGDNMEPFESGKVYLAISATHYQATYYVDKSIFDWLRSREPFRTVAHSIFLYDLTDDPEGIKHLADVLEIDGQAERAQKLLRWVGKKRE